MKLLYTLFLSTLFGAAAANAQLVTITNSTNPVACDGAAYLDSPSQFPSEYTWSWYQDSTLINTGDTAIYNLCAGNYSIVIDSLGVVNWTETFSIGDPCSNFQVTATATPTYPNTCTGSIAITATGGSAPYAYIWSNGTTTQNLTDLCAGTYMISCVDSYGCETTATATVMEYGDSTASIYAYVYAGYDYNGDCQGTANVYPVGGTEPYTIVWSNGDTGSNADSLCAGIYSVTVWDAAGDTTTNTFAVTDPSSTYGNNPFLDSIPVNDPYSYFIENCVIDYNAIDSASLATAVYDSVSQNLYIVWEVYTANGGTVLIYDTLGVSGQTGVYYLSVTVYCPAKSGEQYFGIVGAIYLNADGTLSIEKNDLSLSTPYPNPFAGSLNIENSNGANCIVTLVDATGRIVMTEQSNSELIQLDRLSGLNAGTYFLNIATSNGNKTWKLVK